ncbi:MAG: Ldh family oxidoreductase [Pseudomonadota bacterium]
MSRIELTVDEIHELVSQTLLANGCDGANADAVARTVAAAERDGAESHGLFRVPGYVAALRSGRVRGDAQPRVSRKTAAFIHVDADQGFAPLALERGIPVLAATTRELGVALMTVTRSFHFAALWPEVEALAEENLAGIACVNYAAVMAPHGGRKAIFGTNPLAFAWPRPERDPVVADMATSATARGELMLAKRAGRQVPPGNGLGPDGEPSTDPASILQGVQLPFGGHKGSAIALLVELLAAAATGDSFSDELNDEVRDGGPPRGGEFVLALSPEVLAGIEAGQRSEAYLERFETLPGVRLPGSRRHARRREQSPRSVDAKLVDKIRSLS